MNEVICPICKHPKNASGDGRLTQWMLLCRCDRPRTAAEEAVVVTLCRSCGKRIGEGRSGSLTQFIFRFDICSCQNPSPMQAKADSGSGLARAPGILFGEGTASDPSVIADPQGETAAPGAESPDADEPVWDESIKIDEGFPVERYKPLALLGVGASGAVYLSKDTLLKKKVAVKILRNLSGTQLMSFQEEARTTSKLTHQNIVELHDFAVTPNGAPYMVLEYVAGISLRSVLEREGPLSYIASIPIFQQVCDGLSYAHAHGIFHRDIKPSNLLLSEDSDGSTLVRLIDFGLASVINDQDRGGSTLAGTPLYMSPDQGLNRTFNASSEIYTVGCVLFETLTGRPPFHGLTALETLAMHAELTPPSLVDGYRLYLKQNDSIKTPLIDFPPGEFPEPLEQLVSKCLAKDPNDRFQSMKQLRTALDDLYSCIAPSDDDENLEESRGTPDNRQAGSTAAGAKFLQRKEISLAIIVLATGFIAAIGFIFYLILESHGPNSAKAPSVTPRDPKDQGEYIMHVATDRRLTDIVKPESPKLMLNASFPLELAKDLKFYKYVDHVDLSNNPITDETTSYLNSPYIKYLDLCNTNVETLSYIAKCDMLDNLALAGTEIDNAAIKRISKLPNLISLDIKQTKIDDGAIPDLKRMESLEFLACNGSNISHKGIVELLYALPGCRIDDTLPRLCKADDHVFLTLLKQKQYAKLEQMLRDSIAVICQRQGKSASNLSYYYFNLARVLDLSGRKKEAKVALEKAVAIARQTKNAAILAAGIPTLAVKEFEAKNYRKYVDLITEYGAVGRLREGPSVNHIAHLFSGGETALNSLHDNKKFINLLNMIVSECDELAARKTLLPETRATYLAWTYQRLGAMSGADTKKQEHYYRKAIQAFESKKVNNSTYTQDLANTYTWAAGSCAANGKLDEAVKLQEKAVAMLSENALKGVDDEVKRLEAYRTLYQQQQKAKAI